VDSPITLIEILAKNGPGFLMAGIILAIYLIERKSFLKAIGEERKRSDDLAKAVLSLSTDSVKADTEHTAAIQALTKVLDSIDRRVQ
jgi:hypothetical protein